jgi:hypothetical protein
MTLLCTFQTKFTKYIPTLKMIHVRRVDKFWKGVKISNLTHNFAFALRNPEPIKTALVQPTVLHNSFPKFM